MPRTEDRDEVIVFGDNKPIPMSRGRKLAAQSYVQAVLAEASVDAVKFQRGLVNDEEAPKNVRLSASEAILDRFMGKAAQELRIGETEDRPIVFDSKLRALKEGMEAAIDVASRPDDGSMLEVFERKVTEGMCDSEGVTI